MQINLFFLSINVNENVRNKRKFYEKLQGIPTKLIISQQSISLDYQTWYQTNT